MMDMTTNQLILRVLDAGASITFEPEGEFVRVSAHKPGHTPRTCSTLAKPGNLDFAYSFCRFLDANGFFQQQETV